MNSFLFSLLFSLLFSSVYSTPLIFRCNNLCVGFTGNGRCEDGATGSVASNCIYGSDCDDCGVRPPYTRGPTNEKTRSPTPYNPFGSHSPTDDNSATLTNKPTFSPSLRTAEPTTSSPTTTSPTTSSPTTPPPTSPPTTDSPTSETNSPTPKTKNPTSIKPTTSSPAPTQFPTTDSPTVSPTGSGVCASKVTKDDCCPDKDSCPNNGCKWKNDLCIPSAKQPKTKTPSVSPISASPTSGGGSVLDCTTFVNKQDCCPKNSAGRLGCAYHGCRWDGGLCSSAEKTKSPSASPSAKKTDSPTSTSAPVTPAGCFATLNKFDCCPKNSAENLGCQYHGCRWTNSGVCAEDGDSAKTKKPTTSPVPRPTRPTKATTTTSPTTSPVPKPTRPSKKTTTASPTAAPIIVETTSSPSGIIDCGVALTKETCCPKAAAAALGCEYHGCKWTSFSTCVAEKSVG